MTPRHATSVDFRCANCRGFVSCTHLVSGVHHRNHCPYCLWSRHLDLYAAGDRLAACKAPMQPIALTIKRRRDKYGRDRGELMLVHLCGDCRSISINRIAADDDAHTILGIFNASSKLGAQIHDRLRSSRIDILNSQDLPLVLLRLFGQGSQIPIPQPA